MKVYFYSIHKIDVDPEFYGIPFMALSDDHAQFMLFDAIRKDPEIVNLEEYELLKVGEFDQESGFTSTVVEVVRSLADFAGAQILKGEDAKDE